ncbi:MAG: SH3 domain-containing protein [Anaerolineales bacterium]|nr:SH3 domain-containing protein [Anaerolineales bacterium]
MIQKIKRTFLPLLLMIALSACNMPSVAVIPQGGEEDASILQTITAQALILEQAGWTATPTAAQNQVIVVVTATADGAASATPDAALPPAANAAPPSGAPTVTVSTATNCRTGPGQAYPSIFGLPVGQIAEVVGKNTSTNYWIIKIPNGNGTCWLWGQYATVTGDTSALPTVAIPPTPTPTITPTPKVTVTPTPTTALAPAAPSNLSETNICTPTGISTPKYNLTATVTWQDNSSNEKGFTIYFNAGMVSGNVIQSVGTVGPNTTSFVHNFGANKELQPVIYVEAFNDAGVSSRVAVNISTAGCP